jgi:ribosome-associated translation inhibitor RaiA
MRRGYRSGMQIPLQISLRGMKHSDAIDTAIRKRAAKLGRFCAHITSCRVVLELNGRGKRHGKDLAVHIDLTVPGGEIAITHEHDKEITIALRDAFNAARRRLEDYARRQRGD